MADFAVTGIIEIDSSRAVRDLTKFNRKLKETYAELKAVTKGVKELDGQRIRINVDAKKAEADAAALKAQIEELNRERAEIKLTVESAQAELDLMKIQAEVDKIKGEGDVKINVDTNIEHGPLTEAAQLEAEIRAIDEMDPTIEVQLSAFKAIRQAEELNKEIDAVLDNHKKVKVDVDTRGLNMLQKAISGVTDSIGGGGGGGGMGTLIGAALLAGPAIMQLSVAAAGVAAGVLGAFGTMGAGIGAFAIFAMPIMSQVTKGMKAITTATKGLSGQKKIDALNKALQGVDKTVRPLVKEIYNFKDAITKAGKSVEPKIINTFTTALGTAKSVLGELAPIAGHTADALTHLFNEAKKGLHGSDWKKFFDYVSKNIGYFIKHWGKGVGNFITGIANMIRAFDPLSKFVTGGFDKMSRSFLRWTERLGKSKGFHEFVAAVKRDGPEAWKLIKNIGKVIIDLGKAIGHMPGAGLGTLNKLLTWVDKFVKKHQQLIGMVTAIAGLAMAMSPLMIVFGPVIKGLGKLASMGIGKIAGSLGGLAGESGLLADSLSILGGPIGVVVGALVALTAGLAFTNRKTKEFKGMMSSFHGLWDALKKSVEQVIGIFKMFWDILSKHTNTIQTVQSGLGDIADAFKQMLPVIKPVAFIIGGVLLGAIVAIAYGIKTFGEALKWSTKLLHEGINFIVKIFKWLYDVLVGHSIIPDLVKEIKKWFTMVPDFVKGIFGKVKDFMVSVWDHIKSAVSDIIHGLIHAIEHPFQTIQGIVKDALNHVPGVVKDAFDTAKSAAEHVLGSLVSSAGHLAGRVISSIRSGLSKAKNAVLGAFAGAGSWLLHTGEDIISGLARGIGSMIGKVKGMLGNLTHMIPNWKGPKSVDLKLLEPTGKWIMEGLLKGLNNGSTGVQNFLTKFTNLIQQTMSKIFKNNQVASDAAKAVTDALKPYADAINTVAKEHDKVSAAIDNQMQKLKSLQQAQAQYAQNVQSSIVDYGSVANVTGQTTTDAQGNTTTAPVTANDIVTQMKQKLASAQTFSKQLKQLISLGINKTTLDQLQQMGVDAGSATAKAIIDGGKGTVDEINKLTAALKKTGADMGNSVAKQMYKSGIQSTEAVIRGLESKKKALEREARQLARAMNKAFREALKLEVASGGKLSGKELQAQIPQLNPKGAVGWADAMTNPQTHASTKHNGSNGTTKHETHVHFSIDGKEIKHVVYDEVGNIMKPLKKKTRTGAGKR